MGYVGAYPGVGACLGHYGKSHEIANSHGRPLLAQLLKRSRSGTYLNKMMGSLWLDASGVFQKEYRWKLLCCTGSTGAP